MGKISKAALVGLLVFSMLIIPAYGGEKVPRRLYKEGWNVVSGSNYYPGLTVKATISKGGGKDLTLGETVVGKNGKWTIYFTLEGKNYLVEPPGAVIFSIKTSAGLKYSNWIGLIDGSDPSIKPPEDSGSGAGKDALKQLRKSEKINGFLSAVYPDAGYSSKIYQSIFLYNMSRGFRDTLSIHYRIRDK
ncbi:hypothetical protein JXL21_02320 [Candidatus Bathyarchaeota archaeon]|nr:hypothetical protein [Candidatus Bathyarchaeota archaeon]